MTSAEMDALIEAGALFAWTPGIAFEYSNLGWGLVGRVIERVAEMRPQDLVTERLLVPLGMRATTWIRPAPEVAVAEPYRWQDGEWLAEGEPVGDGQIAPMGGLWSTVRDLATWVGFFQDAWPPRDDPDDAPLPRWARREMQQFRRFDVVEHVRPRPEGPSRVAAFGYGIGLGLRIDERLGVSVGHSGGVPGYGSHMRWLPDRGIGLIGLSNVTYGEMHAACAEALDVLADLDLLGPARTTVAASALTAAAAGVAGLLSAWDDAAADALVADNVAADEPFARRAREAAAVVERHGALAVEQLEPDTPLRGTFTAADGEVKVDLWLGHDGRVQWIDVADRARSSDEPIVSDPAYLATAEGSAFAYVILRPTGGLVDAFETWQGAVLDRLGGARAFAAAAHATLKAFGSSAAPVPAADEPRVLETVAAWAAATPPITLRAEALDVLEGDDERIPVVRLAPIEPLADLWARCEGAGLPAGYSDPIGADGWIAHLSLVYATEVDPARWSELVAWMRGVDTRAVQSTAFEVEVIGFDGGPERRLGRFPFGA